jgi:hypothetical protein
MKNLKQTQTSEQDPNGPSGSKASKSRPQAAHTFNLTTYKLHALGDYVHTIQTFGTSDNFTMQTVSSAMDSNY